MRLLSDSPSLICAREDAFGVERRKSTVEFTVYCDIRLPCFGDLCKWAPLQLQYDITNRSGGTTQHPAPYSPVVVVAIVALFRLSSLESLSL